MKKILLLAFLGFAGYWAYAWWSAPSPPAISAPQAAQREPDRFAFAESFFFKTRVKALVAEVERRTIVSHQKSARPNTTTDMGRQLSALREYTIKEGKLYDDASFGKAIHRALRALGHSPEQCEHVLRRIEEEALLDNAGGR